VNHAPSYILMNPVDVAALDKEKGTDDRYLAANPRTGNTASAWGVSIIESQAVTAGTFFMVDPMALSVWVRNALTVETSNSDGTDFTSNLVTILAEQRIALEVSNPYGVW